MVEDSQDTLDEKPTLVPGGTKESPELPVEETTKEPREEPDEETTKESDEETAQLLTPPEKKVKVGHSSEKEPVVPKNNAEPENKAVPENNEESDEHAKVRGDIATLGWLLGNQPHISPEALLSVLDSDDDVEQNTQQQPC